MGRLELREVTIGYGGKTVISGLSLSLQDGEILSLLGPSGAGKSTVLKVVAGLLQPLSGSIHINGVEVSFLPPERRDVVLIFQKPLLFPFLNVFQNIAFGLRMTGLRKEIARRRIERIVAITELQGLEQRKIHQLSGGQQQRVALARGLVLEPSILLLDEPFSSLDAELREQMRELIRNIQRQTGTTMLFVTHDQGEAFAVSDRTSLLLDGRLRQTGTPEQVFHQPADVDVARFFGCNNMVHGRVSDGFFIGSHLRVPTGQGDCEQAVAAIRPEDIMLYPGTIEGRLPGRVTGVRFEGTTTRLTVETGAGIFSALTIRCEFSPGAAVGVDFPLERLHIFPARRQVDDRL